jgi:hypothetical protein
MVGQMWVALPLNPSFTAYKLDRALTARNGSGHGSKSYRYAQKTARQSGRAAPQHGTSAIQRFLAGESVEHMTTIQVAIEAIDRAIADEQKITQLEASAETNP